MSTEAVAARNGNGAATAALATDLPGGFASLLDELLADQQRLQTPVARFARKHESHAAPAGARHRDLIPLSQPEAGEQYAFEVDLDSCSGCKACVAGCHSLNGLDEEETWRDVGVLLGGDSLRPFQQTVTTACHHCADPGCLNGCPVLAYEKDPVTGIVRHLDDQCIGCQYCVLKCPYDVPKYNERLGIVRKCDMCHQRLAEGEAPACVQACPTEAIRIVKVSTARTLERANNGNSSFLPASPHPAWTKPTTRYVSKRPLPANLAAGDGRVLRPQHAHMPLVFLLVLTQASVGALVASIFLSRGAGGGATFVERFLDGRLGAFETDLLSLLGGPAGFLASVSLLLAAAGLAASGAHLGQPLRAWRVFLNLRRSWLSREAVVFGGYFGLLGATLVLRHPVLALATAVTGGLGVISSIMIYADTPRRFWRLPQSGGRMFGTVLVAALAFLAPPVAAVALAGKLLLEAATLLGDSPSARLQRGPLRLLAAGRFALGLAAVAALAAIPGWPAFLLLLGGELLERRLFFRAVDMPKMPGVPA